MPYQKWGYGTGWASRELTAQYVPGPRRIFLPKMTQSATRLAEELKMAILIGDQSLCSVTNGYR
jgi:hypothetical protein